MTVNFVCPVLFVFFVDLSVDGSSKRFGFEMYQRDRYSLAFSFT